MDFNQFNTIRGANNGAWLHLISPITGDKLYLKKEDPKTGELVDDLEKPCRVKVLGAEGSVAQEMVAEERRKMAAGDQEDLTGQRRIQNEAKNLIVGFENINNGTRAARAPDDNEWFVSLQKALNKKGIHPTFSEQVRDFSVQRMVDLGNVQSG